MIRRTSKLVLEILGTLVGGVAILVAVLAWRLNAGPISLEFVTPYLERALSAEDGAYTVQVGNTVLAWGGWQRALTIRAEDLSVLDANGRPLASVPAMTVRFSSVALMRGVVAPIELELIGMHFDLRRDDSGKFDFQLGQTPGGSVDGAVVSHLVEDLLEPRNLDRPITYLRRVSIVNADVMVEGSHWDKSWQTRLQRLEFLRDAAGVRLRAALDFTVGDATSEFEGTGLYEAASHALNANMTFRGLQPAVVASAIPSLAQLSRFALPFDGSLDARLTSSMQLDRLRFQVSAGEGRVALPEYFATDLPVKRMEARGAVTDSGRRFDLETFFVDLGGPTVSATASATGLDGDSTIAFELTARDVKVDELAQRWPASVAPNPRRWITANLSNGSVDEVKLNLAAHGRGYDPSTIAVDKVDGTMRLNAIDVRYIDKMPKVRAVSGDVRFDDKSFMIVLHSGSTRGLTLDQGTISITDLDTDDQKMAIDISLNGPLHGALGLIDSDPLRYASALGIDAKDVSGDAAIRLAMRFPLVHDLTFARIGVAASATMKSVTIPRIFFDRDLSDGDITLRLNKEGMNVKGDARIAGVPVSLDWNESFGKSAERRVHLTGELDDAGRKAFNLDLGDLLNGPVPLVLDLKTTDRKNMQIDLALDLGGASMTLPRNSWHKSQGVPGKAHVTLLLADGRLSSIRDFAIEAADLVAYGHAAFDPATTALRTVDIPRLSFGRTRLAGKIVHRADGVYAVAINGDSFDGTPLIKSKSTTTGTGETAQPPPSQSELGPHVLIALGVSTLWLSDAAQVALSDAAGTVDYKGGRVVQASIEAKTFNDHKVSIAINPVGGTSVLNIQSDDAGAVLKTLGITDNVIGGQLIMTATSKNADPDGPVPGLVRITNYSLINAPFFAKLLTLASFTGIVDRLNGEGIAFSIFNVPFTKTGDVVRLEDARTVGSQLGITFDGTINFATEMMDLTGTVVPVYTLNSLLGNIPILGQLLVGEKGSGIFAASYTAKGSLDDPDVSVNPLSALAPGFLRGFVNILTSGGGTTPSPPPDGVNQDKPLR